jgi:PAS domain S-box-containing protein
MFERDHSPRSGATPPAFAPSIGLREVLEATPDLVFCCDAWGRFAWVSGSFDTLTGHRTSELVGTEFGRLLAPAGRAAALRAFLRQRTRGTAHLERTLTLERTDGSGLTVQAHVRRWERSDGEIYFVGTARPRMDLPSATTLAPEPSTPEPEALALAALAPWPAAPAPEVLPPVSATVAPVVDEATWAALQRELEDTRAESQSRSEALVTMSHEIRTPMNGIIGMARMLLEGPLGPEQRSVVEIILQSSQSLMMLVNDTLEHARLESGGLVPETLDFDLRVTVEQVGSLLAPLADAKGLAFECAVDTVVPSLLRGDPGRIRQVLLNLGGNAIKFTESGGVSLVVERESEADDAVVLVFRVRDTGIGMSEQEQTRLFQAWGQADASIARRFGGSGLGLAISRRLVEALGGAVGVESAPGEGSTFWFRLPLPKQPPRQAAPRPEPVRLRGQRVLVADPSSTDREHLESVVSAWGCEVHAVADWDAAAAALRAGQAEGRPFGITMLDLALAGEDARALPGMTLAEPALAASRVLLTTQAGRPGDAQRAREAGCAAYLLKPLDMTQLHECLHEVLAHAPAPVAGGERPLVTRHSLVEARRGRLRLLLVEDDPVNQLVTTSALHRVGYHVEVANNGHDAIRLTEDRQWDLILMDMQMPDLDGCRTTAAIRAREHGAWRTPIVGLTGGAHLAVDRDRCLASGMDDVLGKPVDLGELTRTVERWTARDGHRAAEAPAPTVRATPRLTVVSGRFDPPVAEGAEPVAAEPSAGRAPVMVPDPPDGPPVDMSQLDHASMGLPALRTSLLHTFLADVPARIERMHAAFDAADARRVEFEAHGLRGMCATIGATHCVQLFDRMETLARDDRAADARVLVEPAAAEVERVREFIDRFERMLTRDAA